MFAQHGAAQVVLDQDLNGETLRAAVQDLFANPETRRRMGIAARGLARPQAATDLASTVVSLGQIYIEERRKRMVEEAIRKASK